MGTISTGFDREGDNPLDNNGYARLRINRADGGVRTTLIEPPGCQTTS